jgi:hypothetical protein
MTLKTTWMTLYTACMTLPAPCMLFTAFLMTVSATCMKLQINLHETHICLPNCLILLTVSIIFPSACMTLLLPTWYSVLPAWYSRFPWNSTLLAWHSILTKLTFPTAHDTPYCVHDWMTELSPGPVEQWGHICAWDPPLYPPPPPPSCPISTWQGDKEGPLAYCAILIRHNSLYAPLLPCHVHTLRWCTTGRFSTTEHYMNYNIYICIDETWNGREKDITKRIMMKDK